jgi:hypothetical protein
MRALVTVLLLLVVTAAFMASPVSASGPLTQSCNPPALRCSISVTRTITTNDWGVTIIKDSILFNSTAGVSHVAMGMPTSVSASLKVTQANDTTGVNLQVANQGTSTNSSYTTLDVRFPTLETKYNFTLVTVYFGLLTYSNSANKYSFTINPFPIFDKTYNSTTTSTSTFVDTAGWTTPTISPPINQTLSGRCPNNVCAATPLRPFNTTLWTITFTAASSQNILSVSASRTITIAPSGSVQVADGYNLTNLGPTLSSISFKVPKGVSAISESYVLGVQIDQPLTTPTPTANPDGTSSVSFTPSFGSVPFNQSVKVKLLYTLSPSTYITSGSIGSFTLNFALFSNVLFYAPTLQTRIVTPTGFRLNSVNGQVPQSSSGPVVFQVSSVNPMSNLSFSMTYQLDPFWASLSPLSWVGLVELALAASAVAVWRGPGAVGTWELPVQLITKFVDLYDEKSSLRMESDKMEEDVSRGATNRYDYKQRRRSLDRRMAEVDRALGPVKDELASASGRYEEMTKRLERAEAELQVIKTTANDLKTQYRNGKISRDLYESLSADLVKRKDRAGQSVDTIIINLREEIR